MPGAGALGRESPSPRVTPTAAGGAGQASQQEWQQQAQGARSTSEIAGLCGRVSGVAHDQAAHDTLEGEFLHALATAGESVRAPHDQSTALRLARRSISDGNQESPMQRRIRRLQRRLGAAGGSGGGAAGDPGDPRRFSDTEALHIQRLRQYLLAAKNLTRKGELRPPHLALLRSHLGYFTHSAALPKTRGSICELLAREVSPAKVVDRPRHPLIQRPCSRRQLQR